ncbi:hypothetical protein GM182_03150 [bacterium 3DAC]|nr:hypothetical protein GM182_03150 [bacterium 3DAC]
MTKHQKKQIKSSKNIQVQRKRVGVIVSLVIVIVIVLGFIGYKSWEMWNNSPERVAQRFINAFSVYNAGEMEINSTESFWKKEGNYYASISRALGVLADKIAASKGVSKAMLKPQLKIELPPIDQWKYSETSTNRIFAYDGEATLTFPESPSLPNAKVDVHVSLKVTLCKDSGKWRVCQFNRYRKYADWTVYEFVEARMAADTPHLEEMSCKNADESLKNYIDAYDIMVHDPAGDSNYAWVISHIAKLKVSGNKALLEYGLYKVSSQDPTNPVLKWKYVDVKEHLTLCNEDGVWYIKSIYFEE